MFASDLYGPSLAAQVGVLGRRVGYCTIEYHRLEAPSQLDGDTGNLGVAQVKQSHAVHR